jgi:hypothetical protein
LGGPDRVDFQAPEGSHLCWLPTFETNKQHRLL